MTNDNQCGEVKTRKATPEELERYFKGVKPMRKKGLTFAENPFLDEHEFLDRGGNRHMKGKSVIA